MKTSTDQSTLLMLIFFNTRNIPKISEESKKTLDKQLSIAEISEAIGALKAVKTAGPDGLPNDLYNW